MLDVWPSRESPKSSLVSSAPDAALLELLDECAEDGAVAKVLLDVLADALALRVDLVQVDVHPVLEGVGLGGGMDGV